MSTPIRPAVRRSTGPSIIIAAAVALIVGALLGLGGGLAAASHVGGTLVCSVNSDDTVTACTTDSGEQVDVPHHIRIRR
jgi:hypothetical protein